MILGDKVENEMNMRERVLMVLRGETPRHLPFVTRLETWYTAHQRSPENSRV